MKPIWKNIQRVYTNNIINFDLQNKLWANTSSCI